MMSLDLIISFGKKTQILNRKLLFESYKENFLDLWLEGNKCFIKLNL